MKNNFIYNFSMKIVNSLLFKLLTGLILILSIYMFFSSNAKASYIDLLIIGYSSSWYILATNFFIPLILIINLYNEFSRNFPYFNRLKNHKQYLSSYFKSVIISYSFIFLTALIINLILMNFSGYRLKIESTFNDNFPNIIRLMIVLIKVYSITLMICLINSTLIQLLKTPILIIINIAFYYWYLNPTIIMTEISTVFPIFLNPSKYIIKLNYSSVIIEILMFGVYIIILLSIFKLFNSLVLKKIKLKGVIS
ncbi:MAG: hypothetical protein PHI05_01700 [Bacilli bacterium]|nr:hypothetical protein [Bacilli bacterium]MDD4547442.1 hypothetical protein [Bacilli bacterium]